MSGLSSDKVWELTQKRTAAYEKVQSLKEQEGVTQEYLQALKDYEQACAALDRANS
ncbi:hypothetical protein [Spirulina sp. 06S082]|uniref:hypothetical protein n=1 Tax=Spirulina sp. 06S082 TaxID=3110248 RepID=UPI002B1F6365|nr:hypothetical protein [Spirulina sp. 06S082]MEA5471682.1 hypothetical protein [Spirulina sp. 06S082]